MEEKFPIGVEITFVLYLALKSFMNGFTVHLYKDLDPKTIYK